MRLWERENNRNTDNEALFRDMITAAYPDCTLVVSGHHVFYKRGDVTEEIPSADALIFDHTIAKAVWGEEKYLATLATLAIIPAEARDAALRELYNTRTK